MVRMKKGILIWSIISITLLLFLASWLKFFLRPKEAKEAPVKVAIVVDDWGYNLRYLNLLKEIKAPLTISILPNLRYSSRIAEEAKKMGQEVIIHLPLEPEMKQRGYIGLEKNTITARMSEQKVIANINRALASVPYAIGVSNHMGSRSTKDEKLMAVIFRELKRNKLFFLDNLVIDESICGSLAGKMRLKFVQRDFFLDNKNDAEYIREQFKEFSQFARESKRAVAIGHAKPLTLKILKDQISVMQAEGIEFVPISDLVK